MWDIGPGMEISTRHQPNAWDFVLWRVNSLQLPATVAGKFNDYTAVINAAECPIHLNGASQRSAVNYFSVTDRCYV